MPLPIVILANEEKWDCHQCGICCRGSLVPLSDEDLARLRGQKWDEHPDYRNTAITVPNGRFSKSHRLAQRADGSCVFLNDRGLCRIHSELGFDAKPVICRTFPLQLVPRDRNAVLTIRRACPSSAVDRGQTLKGHLPSIQKWVKAGQLSADSISPPRLKVDEKREWGTIHVALEAIGELLQDQRFPPVRRLVHTLQLAHLLETAKTKSMEDRKLIELIRTLVEIVPEESKPYFEERRSPRGYARVLFRFMAIEYARLHPHYHPSPSWQARLQLGVTAFRLVRGRRQLPRLNPPFPTANFEDLENPLGPIDASILDPLSRMIETSAASYLYALANRRGWTLLDSVRGLAAIFPVGLWLLRWIAHTRTPTLDDMIHIVVALDRGQGYHALEGSIHRRRIRNLAFQNELERLVVWYAR